MYAVGYREAVLDFYYNNHTYRETSEAFDISQATLAGWIKKQRETGSLNPCYRGSEPKIDREALRQYMDEHPDAYQYEVAEVFGCSQSCICHNLQKIGYTLKKKTTVTQNRTLPA